MDNFTQNNCYERRTSKTDRFINLIKFVLDVKRKDIKKENQTNIVGTWLLNTTSKSNCDDPDFNGLQSHQCTDDNCTKYIFSSDSTRHDLH
ncbi:hypothetical protein [Marinoscillum sp.]|uniref:hypothetical protein n=1 Tax=Marinoscillum sp. TaxID=2024838 RepID=UPI003BA964E0